MEDSIRLARLAHELVEALGGAGKHVGDVGNGEAHALGFAGGAGGVDDGDDVGIAARTRSVGNRLRRRGLLQDFVEEHAAWCAGGISGPCLHCGIRERGVAHKKQLRLGVFHHGGELRRRLPGIKRDHDECFGHQRQIKCGPANRVGREESAAIARAQIAAAKIGPHLADLIEQFPAGNADELLAVNFAQNHASGTTLQLSRNSFEEVGHEPQKLKAPTARGRTSSLLIATRIRPRNVARSCWSRSAPPGRARFC